MTAAERGGGERGTGICVRHADTAAGYRCCECGQLLCDRCVKIGSHLIFCGLCGERAIELDELDQYDAALAGPRHEADWAAAERLAALQIDAARKDEVQLEPTRPAPIRTDQVRPDDVAKGPRPWRGSAPPPDPPGTAAAVFAVNHAVIPAATIAMVSALLFFLLDVRSVFLTDTTALKWIGFWFVVATVLIARYDRTSANAERQGCYTVALAGATVTAMTVRSAAHQSGGFVGLLANLLIVFVVWRFATRLTHRLSFEGSHTKTAKPRLYGTERLHLEQLRRDRGEAPAKAGREQKKPDDGGNPVAPVARLAAAGLLAFALGEPFLLAGPPAAGERALAAMIVFLLAAGVVLAAASGLGNLKRVRALGGQASLGMLPGRVAAAVALMVMLSALALAMPGIQVRGTGAQGPAATEDGDPGGDSGEASEGENEGSGSEQPAQARQRRDNASGRDPQRDPRSDSRESRQSAEGLSGAAASLIGQLAALGQWLRYAVVILAALLALWGLWWILNHLGSTRQWLSSIFGGFFRRLFAGLGGLFRRRKKQHRARRIDPFADWQTLRQLEPREAVVAAYGRLLAAFELLEHPRPERQTPYEFVATLPAQLKQLAGPARDLTEIYVKAAYSGAPIGDADRREALAALEEIKVLHQSLATGAAAG